MNKIIHQVIAICSFLVLSGCAVSSSVAGISTVNSSEFKLTDGKVNLVLDSPYSEFLLQGLDEIHSEYVGETYNETFMYKTYLHSYDGFDLYTSNANYNLKGRSFDEYYISQITSKSPDFYSSRGITAGSTVDKVMDAYGNTNILEKEGDSFVSYDYEDMKMSYFLDANDVVEEIVFRTM